MDENDRAKVAASFTSLELGTTYGGLIEGTRESYSKYLREELAEEYPTNISNDGYALVIPDGPAYTRCLFGPA